MVALSVFFRALKSGQTGSGKSERLSPQLPIGVKPALDGMFAEHLPTSLMGCKYTPAVFRAASG